MRRRDAVGPDHGLIVACLGFTRRQQRLAALDDAYADATPGTATYGPLERKRDKLRRELLTVASALANRPARTWAGVRARAEAAAAILPPARIDHDMEGYFPVMIEHVQLLRRLAAEAQTLRPSATIGGAA